jgi:hypothetical protein
MKWWTKCQTFVQTFGQPDGWLFGLEKGRRDEEEIHS